MAKGGETHSWAYGSNHCHMPMMSQQEMPAGVEGEAVVLAASGAGALVRK